MNFLSKLRLSFDGCMVVVIMLAGVGFLVWGYVLDTLRVQAMASFLFFVCFGAALFIRTLARRIEEDAELEAEAAAFVRASQIPGTQDESDEDPSSPADTPEPSVMEAIQQVFTKWSGLFDPPVSAAHR
jgi:hypothetical protein